MGRFRTEGTTRKPPSLLHILNFDQEMILPLTQVEGNEIFILANRSANPVFVGKFSGEPDLYSIVATNPKQRGR